MAKNPLLDGAKPSKQPATNSNTQVQTQQQAAGPKFNSPLLSGAFTPRRTFNIYDTLSRAMASKQISPEKIFAKGEQTHQDRLKQQEELDARYNQQKSALHDYQSKLGFFLGKKEDRATFEQMKSDFEKTKAEKKALDKDIRKGIDWEGRDALIDEYKKLDRAGYLNPKMAARKEEIRKQLASIGFELK